MATTAIAGLAAAGPALAAEEPPPAPPPVAVPDVPDLALPEVPVPEIPVPELVEPPVVVTHVDAENIDVSIRILSPGEDGSLAQESATTLISPASETGITEPTEDIGPDAASTEPSGAVNTNVSIRVLSPGDRGEVAQGHDGSGEEVVEAGVVRSAPPSADAAPASTGPSEAPQYQDDNSQYQSESDSWNWNWTLVLDCAGNATSSSAETGRQESLVWSWEWTWEWGCGDTAQAEPTGTSASSSTPPAAEKPPDRTPSPLEPRQASAEPWSWTWTFTFCGETSTIATSAGAGTPLVWTWDWSWTWSCGGATEPDATSPTPAIVAPPLAEPEPQVDDDDDSRRLLAVVSDAAAEPLPSVWFPTFTMTGNRETATTFVWPSMPEPPLELTVEVAIPPVVLPISVAPPLTSPIDPFSTVDVSAEPTSTPRPATAAAPRSLGAVQAPAPIAHSLPEASARTAHPQARAHHVRSAKHADAKSRRADRSRTPFVPVERPQPRQAAGSSTGGGFVPSALLLGVAALTGSIVFAAPGIGRRIRVARELSPRGLGQSPLDRPG